MKKLNLIFTVVLLASAAHAEQTVGSTAADNATKTLTAPCSDEQVTLYTTHTYNGYSIDDAQSRFDADKERIRDLAIQAGAKLKFTSENYSINPMNYDAPDERNLFNYSGNVNYEVSPASKGKDFFRKLSAAGINASLSYSKSNNCDEQQAQGE